MDPGLCPSDRCIWTLFKGLRIKSHYRLLRFIITSELPDETLGDYTESKMLARISLNQSDWQMHWTGFHELLHALSDAYNLKLSEAQVQGLETAIMNVYRYNIGFTLDPPERKQ